MVSLILVLIGVMLSGPVALGLAFNARRRIGALERRLLQTGTQIQQAPFVLPKMTRAEGKDVSQTPRPTTREPRPDMPIARVETDHMVAAAAPRVLAGESAGKPAEEIAVSTKPAQGAAVSPATVDATIEAVAAIRPGPTRTGWSRHDIEEAIGTRWAVWLGGIAIAIGGALLVRQIAQAGLFGPGARILAGYALALATGLAAERLRRSERDDAQQRWPRIPAVLNGAALMIAYATTYAAHGLYGFIGAGPALLALGALGLGALALSKRYGEPMAGLGLLGALGAPLLLGTSAGTGGALAIYLPVIAGTSYAVAIRRRWLGMALATAAGSLVWAVGVVNVSGSAIAAEANLFAQAILAVIALDAIVDADLFGTAIGLREATTLTSGAIAIAGGVVLTQTAVMPNVGWPLVAVAVVAVLLAHGARRALSSVSTAAAATLSAWTIATWPAQEIWPGDKAGLNAGDPHIQALPTDLHLWSWAYAAVATAVPLGILCIGAARTIRSRGLHRADAATYAAAGAAAPALSILAAQAQWDTWPSRWVAAGTSPGWAVFALVAAIACAGAAFLMRKLTEAEAHAKGTAAGIMAAGAATSVALAAWLGLAGTSLTLVLSATAAASALIDRRWHVPELRWYVSALAAWVAGRIGLDPVGAADAYGLPVWLSIAVAYGVPASAFALAGRWLGRSPSSDDAPAFACWSLSMLLSAAAAFLEIHQGVNGGTLHAPVEGLAETGLATIVAAGYAAMLTGRARGPSALRKGAYLIAFWSVQILALAGTLIFADPAISGEPIGGGRFANDIALGYALPALALFGLGRMAWKATLSRDALVARASATILVFAYATLSIRFWFQGPLIVDAWNTTGQAESLCYSAAWLAIGLGILAYGIVRRSFQARVASAGFVLASVVKVFLFDLAGIDGLGRAASFILLGAVLIGIGLLYQKLVFAKPRVAAG